MDQEPENVYSLPESEPSGEIDPEKIKGDFTNYLDGKIAPLFVAESLSHTLGTEGNALFDPKQVADFVAAWAQMRSLKENKPPHEFYLKSVELIVTADRTGVLTGFKPSTFYIPYFEGLVSNCRPEDRDQFRERLKQLREELIKQWSYDFRRNEFEQTSNIESKGLLRKEPQDVLKAIINRLQTQGEQLSPMEEQAIIADLKRNIDLLARKPGFAITPQLENLINISINLFNSEHISFSAELLYIVQQTYNWSGIDEATREWLRNFRSVSELNISQLKGLIGKPDLRKVLMVFLTHFEDLNPYNLLSALAAERDRQQRRLLTSLIEAHGDAAAALIMDTLSKYPPQTANDKNWFFTRNLIYLLGRVAPKDPESQQTAANLIGPFLRAPVFQLRIATLTGLENLNSEFVMPFLAQVFTAGSYTEQELKNLDRVLTYLNNAISLVSKQNHLASIQLLVEIAVGQRLNFIPEKLNRPLRLQALQVLSSRREELSPALIAPVIERIRNMTKWKIMFVSRLLGEDEEQLLAMIDLVAAVPTEETIQLLKNIQSRYSNKSLGQRAAELLQNSASGN
jgi:hypothetical protein